MHRGIAWLLLNALLASPIVSYAQTPPPVILSPATNTLNGVVPVGGSFTLQVPMLGREADDVTGTLDIWPIKINSDCSQPFKGSDQRQHYFLSMTYNGTDKMLQATVPPLQPGERFCFHVERQAAISKTRAELLSASFAEHIVPYIDQNSFTMDKFHKLVAKGLKDLVDSQKLRLQESKKAALEAQLKRSLESAAAERIQAQTKHRQLMLQASEVANEFAASKQRLLAMQNASVPTLDRHVFILVPADGKPRVIDRDTLVLGKLTSEELGQVLQQMKKRDLTTQARALSEAYAATDSAKRGQMLDAFQLQAPSPQQQAIQLYLPLPNSQLLVLQKPTQLAKSAVEDRDTQRKTLEQLVAYQDYAGQSLSDAVSFVDSLQPWIQAFKARIAAEEANDEAPKKAADAERESKKALEALEANVKTIFQNDEVRLALIETLEPLAPLHGHATPPGASNYIAIDLGLAVAVPLSGGHQDPWLLPYVGLNIYSIAVDRTLPLSQLVGPWWRHRLSLTVGVTLATAPTIPGRTVTGPVLDRYPLVALGWRVTGFIRAVGGVSFFRLSDINPASTATSLGLAPFVALSADIDLINTFMTQLGKYPQIKP